MLTVACSMIAQQASVDAQSTYFLHIGSRGNTKTSLYVAGSSEVVEVDSPNIVHPRQSVPCWLSWDGGRIRFGLGNNFNYKYIDYDVGEALYFGSLGLANAGTQSPVYWYITNNEGENGVNFSLSFSVHSHFSLRSLSLLSLSCVHFHFSVSLCLLSLLSLSLSLSLCSFPFLCLFTFTSLSVCSLSLLSLSVQYNFSLCLFTFNSLSPLSLSFCLQTNRFACHSTTLLNTSLISVIQLTVWRHSRQARTTNFTNGG